MENTINGRIIRIKLINFLTYDDCEIFPGDKLNVVLGPNGTGKSSIVCAICLGLGGSPMLLGRAKDIGDYIKHRCAEAMVEIELSNTQGPNLVVKRQITRGDDGKAISRWWLKGKVSHQKEVVDTVAKMNVQMNNLCQFLPQDKVVEFAKMNPQQLLEATEKAVGPPGMYEDHMKLIEVRGKFTTVNLSMEEKIQAKDRIEQRNKLLERDVQRHKEREKHTEKIEFLEKKKPWVEYKNAREQYVEANTDKTNIGKKISEMKKLNAPLENQIKKKAQSLTSADAKMKELKEQGNSTVKKWKTMYDRLEREQEKVEEVRQELSQLKKEETSRQNKIDRLEKEYVSLEKDHEAAPDPEEMKPEVESITGQIREIQMNLHRFQKECNEYNAEITQQKSQMQALKYKLRELENYEHQRLENLRRIDRQTYEAVMWLRENQGMFSGTVYEPIMTQINMKNMKDATYLESIVSNNDMKAFVCQNREDQNLFSNKTRDELKLNVNIVCPPMDAKDEYLPNIPMENIKRYGFKNYITDLYEAPKTVHQYLCESYHLHNIPVGGVQVNRNSEQVIANVQGLHKFCSNDSIYTVKRSKYTGYTSTSVNNLRTNLDKLKTSVDLDQKKQFDTELGEVQRNYNANTAAYQERKKQHDAGTKEYEVLKEKKKNLVVQMKRRSVLLAQMETKKKRLEEIRAEIPNMEVEERKSRKKIEKINEKRLGLTKEYQQLVQQCITTGQERLCVSMKQVQARMELAKLEDKLRNSNESLRTLEESHALVARRCQDLKARARQLASVAREKTGKGEGDNLIPSALEEVFKTLPDTIEEIEGMIHEEQARLNCQYETNPQVIKDYNKNKTEIASLEDEISKSTKEMEEMQAEIDALLSRWLVPLEQLLKRINEQYFEFFRRMGCAGQVSLQKDPNDDYRKFGVEIQVKFRAEAQLKVLTPHHQSGGERSVSTMLYLISLQEMTKCPFRLVDEINQGMDPNNERRVFDLVVETVCRPNTSQYFLITPKLLPDLRYVKGMHVLTVLNGHWMVQHQEFHVKDFVQKKKKLDQRQGRAVAVR